MAIMIFFCGKARIKMRVLCKSKIGTFDNVRIRMR